MTAGDAPTRHAASGLGLVLAFVIVAAALLGALLVAGQAGLLPRAPADTGPVAGERYLSPQSIGERAAEQVPVP
jgi:hypothetical protein